MNVTLKDILDAETATRKVRAALDAIGRELYKMREGDVLGPQFGFDSYQRMTYQGDHCSGQDGPDWGVGTDILSISFYWPRASDQVYVTLPRAWIDADWRALEQARLDEVRERNEAQAKIDRERFEHEQDQRDRATYEELKAKFEPSVP